jgi:hypothetical protein
MLLIFHYLLYKVDVLLAVIITFLICTNDRYVNRHQSISQKLQAFVYGFHAQVPPLRTAISLP